MRYLTSQSLCMFTILWYILTFILVVFCGETKSKVVKSQNKAVRIIKDVPPMEPIYPHYVALRLLKLPDVVKVSTCLLFYEYVNDDNDLSFSLTLCCELREGGGGGKRYSWKFLVGLYRPVLQILTRFQTKTDCNSPRPFSDQISKIHTRFQTWQKSCYHY